MIILSKKNRILLDYSGTITITLVITTVFFFVILSMVTELFGASVVNGASQESGIYMFFVKMFILSIVYAQAWFLSLVLLLILTEHSHHLVSKSDDTSFFNIWIGDNYPQYEEVSRRKLYQISGLSEPKNKTHRKLMKHIENNPELYQLRLEL